MANNDSAEAPHVRTEAGALRGAFENGVASFKNIPYAAPPVGPLRWRAPQPVTPWDGVRDARAIGPIAMQKFNAEDNGVGPLPMSEDCLQLNVWTPAARAARPLPVMVWIHGGGLVNGSGTAALYDGSELARQGVVCVTLNYRLGRLGFFAHPELSAEQAGGELGNYGFMDQIAALEWVSANIAAFGGDPCNVTLMGESAGGVSVQRHMMIPRASKLFHKAIVQSGAGLERDTPLAQSEAAGVAYAKSLGAANLAALRALPAERFVEGDEPSLFTGFGPVLDGVMLSEHCAETFAAGQQARMPLLIGSNELEFPMPKERFDLVAMALLQGRDKKALKALYPSERDFRLNVVSDVIFTAPARRIAALHAATGAPTYLFRFCVLTAAMRASGQLHGAPHASERQYMFRTLHASPWPTDANDALRAEEMSAYWVNFAHTGDPNGAPLPAWPRYSAQEDVLLNFLDAGPRAMAPPDANILDAIVESRP